MGQSIYLADPVVAAAYQVAPGEWAWIVDDAEADWLIVNRHGYTLARPVAVPAPYFVNPLAPLPFVPYAGSGAGPPASAMKVTITNPQAGVFVVAFGGSVDTVDATAHFVVKSDVDAPLADVTYTQPAGTTRQDAAGLLQTALTPYSTLALTKNGALLDIRGATDVTVGAVEGGLTIPPVQSTRAPARRRAAS